MAWLLLAPGLLYLAVFYVVPTVQMFLVSLQTGSPGTGYQQTWNFRHLSASRSASTGTSSSARSSYGGLATLLCFLLGFPLAYFIAFRGGRYKSLLLFLIIAPFFTSFLLRTLSWKIIFADNGMILGPAQGHRPAAGLVPAAGDTDRGHRGHHLQLPAVHDPAAVRGAREDAHQLLEAAADLYAGTAARFWRVTFPMALPGIVAGSLLTFIPAVGDFVNAELLGNPKSQMIGNVIQAKFLKATDYPAGAALSFTLMFAILAAVLIYARLAGTEQLYGAKA